MARAGQSTTRLIVSADAINANDELPTVYAMHVVDSDPGSLLAVRVGELGWAFALEIDRPPRRRLVKHLGRATPEELEQVDNAIRAVFDHPGSLRSVAMGNAALDIAGTICSRCAADDLHELVRYAATHQHLDEVAHRRHRTVILDCTDNP